jgi:hypothetical protein|tara:strand:- start:1175 stop:1363 length:189 start_codon:yes stop_codon:yes gene_type:complete
MSEFNTRTREGVDEWMEKLSEAGVTDEHLVQCFAVSLTPEAIMEVLDANELSPRLFDGGEYG